VRDTLIIFGIAVLIGGWWDARNALLYQDPLSIGTHVSDHAPLRPIEERLSADLRSIEHTFWANPARSFVSPMPLDTLLIGWGRLSLLLGGLSLLLSIGQRSFFKGTSPKNSTELVHKHVAAWSIILSWPLTFAILLLGYWTRKASWAYGRLLFPSIASFALIFTWGWAYGFPARWRRITLTLGVGALILISILYPFLSIYPLYHPWRPYRQDAIAHTTDIHYVTPQSNRDVARLLGYEILNEVGQPGHYLPVVLCWEPLGRTPHPYEVFVHVLDLRPNGIPTVWGSRRTYPGLGNKPTDRWALGQAFCDEVLVDIADDIPMPLGTLLEIGFIDPQSDRRLQPMATDGPALSLATVRGIPIVASDALEVPLYPPLYHLDAALNLVHLQLSPRLDHTLRLTLTWQAQQSVPYDATSFIHLDDAEGHRLTQIDRQPLNGRFPTSYWVPPQMITDTYTLQLDTPALTLPLKLHAGMYTWPSLDRLPVVDADGVPQPDHAVTLSITSLPYEKRSEP